MYYLNSRYYNPEWGRFINGDNILIQNKWLCGNNLYLYCNNSPTNFHDYTGRYISPILPASELYNFSYVVVCTTNEDEYRVAITIENKIFITTLSQEAYSFTFSLNPDFEPKYSYTLSAAMTEIFETIYDKKMEGRTVTGIETELNIHKSAYDITRNSRVDTANIGTNKNDSNAWMFEVIDNFALNHL